VINQRRHLLSNLWNFALAAGRALKNYGKDLTSVEIAEESLNVAAILCYTNTIIVEEFIRRDKMIIT